MVRCTEAMNAIGARKAVHACAQTLSQRYPDIAVQKSCQQGL